MKQLISLSAVLILAFYSCKKDKIDTDTQSAVDNNICEVEFARIVPEINTIALNTQGINKVTAVCPLVSADTSSNPKTITIDYGGGCLDSIDNKVRKGQIKVSFSGAWRIIGTKATATFTNYFVNEIQYDGKVEITRLDTFVINHKVIGGKCTNTSYTLLWNCDRTISINNSGTVGVYSDDVYTIYGTASGTDRKGKSYAVNITTALVKSASCPYISSGLLSITPDGLSARTFDFGSGTCDDVATLKIDESAFTIKMK